MHEHPVTVTVNGRRYAGHVEARMTLADHLRENCGLTGTHLGCEHGACGACTVLLDGQAVRSCLIFAVQVDGQEVTTVEGIAGPDGSLSPVQAAMRDCHGLQCGFCTPGFVTSITALLRDNPQPTEAQSVMRFFWRVAETKSRFHSPWDFFFCRQNGKKRDRIFRSALSCILTTVIIRVSCRGSPLWLTSAAAPIQGRHGGLPLRAESTNHDGGQYTSGLMKRAFKAILEFHPVFVPFFPDLRRPLSA